ncbi:nuclear transport factor 2 family protein [Streptomyces sporangiiformans]|uniref:Nuclear transport factor 2 family protein n=1 Tax=Streptomyces sporangiiformans TaxID=2315329 RepID=A0A505DQ72_9ACTN|nr:nuclear transport factor 2 family protein [Streptomyces sporangiiformans]TPQ23312.1 nuclear transport factor 2 family protein [Streptomyces sporangiiformans]
MTLRRDRAMNTLTRYLQLCDVPVPSGTEGELGDLFTDDAVWEGVGPKYGDKFGRTEGRQAIAEMVSAYLPPNSHFRENVHLLFPGNIDLGDSTARGSWLMQQLSRYESGAAEVMVARLDVTFRFDARRALISRFRTEQLFSSPLAG